jgi:8-oxo-dGTP pyrophosphatase MutT (NUDIX family)
MKPDLQTTFIYKDRTIAVKWFDIKSKADIPTLPWSQVYVVGNIDGGVPVVTYPYDAVSLPGGTVEEGETIDVTLRREVREELNARIVGWVPLGYQESSESGYENSYQLRVYAQLEIIGPFTSDPGGDVTGYRLVPLQRLNDTLKWGEVGERIQRLATDITQSRDV